MSDTVSDWTDNGYESNSHNNNNMSLKVTTVIYRNHQHGIQLHDNPVHRFKVLNIDKRHTCTSPEDIIIVYDGTPADFVCKSFLAG